MDTQSNVSSSSPSSRFRSIRPPRVSGGAQLQTRDVLVAAIAIGAAIVAGWPVVLAFGAPGPVQIVPLVAHVFGMLAGYGIIVLLGLMSRAPVLERDIGADTLTGWHALGGRVVLTAALIHAWAAVVAWAQSRRVSTASASWQVLRLPWLTATTIGTGLLVAVAVVSIRAARRRLSYERWHAVHLLTYVGVALVFVHQLAGPDLAGHRLLQIAWAMLYVQVFALLLRYRVLAPLRQARRHRLRVAGVVPEAPGVMSIEIDGEHLDELRAEAGQFFRWRFLTPDLWLAAHPFSLSSSPTDRRLRLTVKALGAGSAHLHDVSVGTWVVAEGPYGAMTAARRTRNDVVLIAGGVGITPMRALFESLALAPGQTITLIYRARTHADVIFHEELEQLAARRGAQVHYLLGDDRSCLTAPALLALVPLLPSCDVYLCGPPAMTSTTRSSLVAAGVTERHIHEERFAW